MSSKRKNFERKRAQSEREAEALLDTLAARDEEDFVARDTDAFVSTGDDLDSPEDFFPEDVSAAESMGRKHLK